MTGGVVVLGGAGMLGHKLFQVLRERFPGTIATTRAGVGVPPLSRVSLLAGPDVVAEVDAADFEALRARLERLAPAVIVNCIGVVKQKDEAAKAIPTITLNALLPHRLAEASAAWGGRVIHFSTDCIFSGRRGSYREEDVSDAEDLYGRSKFLGEVAAPNAITLRTSIVGRELTSHRSLLEWFLAQKGKKVRGFRKVIYSGITTNEMANVVSLLIGSFPTLSGLFQVASDPIAKYDLLLLIRKAYGLEIEVEPDDREVSDRSMRGERFRDATGWRAPSWPDMVAALAADPTPYDEWRTTGA